MTLKVGDNVRVRFNMSKYNGMVEFANEVKAKRLGNPRNISNRICQWHCYSQRLFLA